MKVGVIGASGYTGLEWVRIVLRHPRLELVAATSEQRAGQPLGEAFPAFRGLTDVVLEAWSEKLADRLEAAFLCLPHATAAPVVVALRKADVPVVDLSADFRLRDAALYEEWYGPHGAAEYFGQAVYGMPEVYREALRDARLIAAPGCYPTGALLPMLPFLRTGAIAAGPVIVDAKTGVSGGGRSLNEDFLLGELEGNVHAYKVAAHRHGPEMEQEAALAAGRPVQVTFVPQLLPLIRGIATSVYLQPSRPFSAEEAHAVLTDAYRDEPFVRVLPPGETPQLANVRGSNFCDVAVVVDPRHGTLIALSAIDNLVKGSGGQGMQAFNVARGWPETEGLLEAPLRP